MDTLPFLGIIYLGVKVMSQTQLSAKYNAKAYEEIKVRVKKGEKEKIKAHAQKQGESVNGYINRSMKNQMESDNNENN